MQNKGNTPMQNLAKHTLALLALDHCACPNTHLRSDAPRHARRQLRHRRQKDRCSGSIQCSIRCETIRGSKDSAKKSSRERIAWVKPAREHFRSSCLGTQLIRCLPHRGLFVPP